MIGSALSARPHCFDVTVLVGIRRALRVTQRTCSADGFPKSASAPASIHPGLSIHPSSPRKGPPGMQRNATRERCGAACACGGRAWSPTHPHPHPPLCQQLAHTVAMLSSCSSELRQLSFLSRQRQVPCLDERHHLLAKPAQQPQARSRSSATGQGVWRRGGSSQSMAPTRSQPAMQPCRPARPAR